ncbi:hypothetical protein MLD38_009127 [Melastoma candidum]|uniref:Uncharacterized protein n=1 Tax=Melastoma candidum TaxID=119954 RepID=A0ACB9RXV1_9MYRT|nr:hypothetical protein MLD38_009127 [Melastoma candidum]
MSRALKLCCLAMASFLAVLAAVVISLSLTVFKPKQPEITAHPFGLENLQFNLPANDSSSNVTIGMLVTIENPNYSGFEYQNSAAQINYRGIIVGEVPIERRMIPARSKVNITSTANLIMDKLIAAPGFIGDFLAGHLEMVSAARLPGKVVVLKIVRFPATVNNTCRININIESHSANSKCITRIKY